MEDVRKKISFRAILIPALGIACLVGGVSAWGFMAPHLPPAEQGRRLAQKNGCFTCHGPAGVRGAPNPGRTDLTVPAFEGDLMMYAEGEEEIREWIHDGVTAKRAGSKSWQKQRDAGALTMPAFGTRLSEGEIDDLVDYVMAVHGEPLPSDSLARAGLKRAGELGCFGCHGPGGRLAPLNPGSLKGYLPSWDGKDFPELVRNRAEFEEWVEKGISMRFERNPIARFFLERALLKMPAYQDHLNPGDVSALWAYVAWLRADQSPRGD